MREIKFRALQTLSGLVTKMYPETKPKMIYGTGIFFDRYNTWLCSNDSYKCMAEGMEMHIIQKETLGQYTGLKDKNGKKIYEGDICIVSLKFFDIKKDKSIVIFKDGQFVFQYGCTDEYVKSYNAWDVNSIEMIGNIYENHELINWRCRNERTSKSP